MTADAAPVTSVPAAAPQGVRDRADVLVDLFGEPDSGLDAATKKLSVRVRRLANHVERELRRELAAEGIEVWELEVLLALRRAPRAGWLSCQRPRPARLPGHRGRDHQPGGPAGKAGLGPP